LVLAAGAVDASVDESAAAFLERDFLVEAVDESVLEAVEDFDAVESSAAALLFLDFEVDFEVEVEPEAELSVELASEDAAFFFFLLFDVVLLSVLELLAELLGVVLDCAFATEAPIETEARTRAAHASAMYALCQMVFMIISPESGCGYYEFCLFVRPAA
jgi:hypothetical protein